jgi:hypothetical protein
VFASLIALLYRYKSIHSKLILKAHESSLIAFIIDYNLSQDINVPFRSQERQVG